MMKTAGILLLSGILGVASWAGVPAGGASAHGGKKMHTETITLAGGCFWCMEAIFQELKGVENVESGYSGGDLPNPTYKQVSEGDSGYAESVQITFDPKVLPLETLLKVFFSLHDPTTLNRQGADVGPQYRSAIFYRDPEQKMAAEALIHQLTDAQVYSSPIVTEVVPFKSFYKAEAYHQNYYRDNPNQPYCRLVISPKLVKLDKLFKDDLKK